MKESYGEGLANHAGPESCGVVRENGVEALTGVRAGWVLSRERRINFGVPTTLDGSEGYIHGIVKCKMPWNPARSETPHMYGNSLRENRESHGLSAVDGTADRIGKSKDARR